jgi:hypothetical protein
MLGAVKNPIAVSMQPNRTIRFVGVDATRCTKWRRTGRHVLESEVGMLIEDGKKRFALKLLRQEGEQDAGLQWLQTQIVVDVGADHFRKCGPWLTSEECQELIAFLTKAGSSTSALQIAFIEPNLAFGYAPDAEELTVELDQEAKPLWLRERLCFKCPPHVCPRLASELSAQLASMEGTN